MRAIFWGRTWFGVVTTSALLSSCGDVRTEPLATSVEPLVGDAFAGLSADQQLAFANGKDAFEEEEEITDGLGPVFNEKSCAVCHSVGAVGGSGTQFEVRAGKLTGTSFDSLTTEGGQLFDLFSVTSLPGNQKHLVPSCTLAKSGEPIPSDANVVAKRRTTALFGLGLVDATRDSTFVALAAAEPPAFRGRVNMVFNIAAGQNTVGKFGWKAQVPTLHQFSGDAYLNEMGITNPEFSVEQPPSGNAGLIAACDLVLEPEDDGDDVDAFTDFMVFLAPVPPLTENSSAQAGDALFTQIGCDGCHRRNLTSGPSPIAALNNQTYHPFSDFLVHDMGTLGDGIGNNGIATVREMRTAPLWGLRLVKPMNLLHDGRAKSLDAAVMAHDGQGANARNSFAALTGTQKAQVVAFLETL
jgi:CxxC motif-containing protein (DUF1111 family)